MCGIVGYVGGRAALPLIMGGLARLEYRGYDSAGVAIQSPGGELVTAKKAGVLDNLRTAIGDGADLAGSTGMGHTRWATHGGPTDRNAHPHADGSGRLAVIHNGIIENFAALRTELESAGVEPVSDTDTEVVAHLLGAAFAAGPTAGDLTASMQAVCRRLHGTFTLVALHADRPGEIVAARRSSPLVLGVGDGEMFLASDVSAFLEYTRDAVELGQDQVVTLTADSYLVTDFLGNPLQGKHFHVDWEIAEAERGGYPTFMDKEIAEQPEALANTLRGHFDGRHILLDEQRMSDDDLRTIDKVFVVACGSAYHSGLVAKYAIEHWARLPVEVELASEFRYRDPILDRATLVVAVSQSGETMDTLEALRHARRQKATVLAVCNTNGAQIPRESDAVLYTHAGPEIGVASTKAFLAQVAANYLLGLALAQARGTKYPSEIAADFDQLAQIPDAVRATLAGMDPVRRLGQDLATAPAVLFLGRHVGYPVALEGALKLKELAYMHAEGFAAGELKHGPIALVEDGLPMVIVMPSAKSHPMLHRKMLSNIREVQSRGARTIVIAEEGDDTVAPFADTLIDVPIVPPLLQPLVATVPLQILAAEIARARGYDIDKPRNLAKSVTVE
ncbi:MAG: glutamine--fructose-6-phosphate aminotransferase [Actinobacteria bacterium 69-20]|nr:glutamine--fructose-6-phosphate transaminase (isomerizing) [Actinomycetota bacterium]OJV23876.1 MAG: glutamine--fructose-6-phosphate aminotransferase [Actinobacteria bacterium 69-20]